MGARFPALFCITVAAWLSWVSSQAQTPAPQPAKSTFTNPLLNSGPDPWVTSRDGWYYYMNTTTVNLIVRKTRDITDLRNAQSRVVWNAPASGPYSKDIWAPEIHFVNGKWYIFSRRTTTAITTHTGSTQSKTPPPIRFRANGHSRAKSPIPRKMGNRRHRVR